MQDFINAFHSVNGVTIYSVNRKSDSWRYATARNFHGYVEVKAVGYHNWTSLSSLTSKESANPHQRFVIKLATYVAEGLTAGYPVPEPYQLAIPVKCKSGCGKILTHPRSIEAEEGPECRGLYAERKAKQVKRTLLAESFVTRMAARKGYTAPVAVVTRCPGTCAVDTHCPDCDS